MPCPRTLPGIFSVNHRSISITSKSRLNRRAPAGFSFVRGEADCAKTFATWIDGSVESTAALAEALAGSGWCQSRRATLDRGGGLSMPRSDLSDVLREAVECALAEFCKAKAPGVPKETKQAAALKLELSVINLGNYLLRDIIPVDLRADERCESGPDAALPHTALE
jgi:hypothetical protein